jgi:hypothetical protein
MAPMDGRGDSGLASQGTVLTSQPLIESGRGLLVHLPGVLCGDTFSTQGPGLHPSLSL